MSLRYPIPILWSCIDRKKTLEIALSMRHKFKILYDCIGLMWFFMLLLQILICVTTSFCLLLLLLNTGLSYPATLSSKWVQRKLSLGSSVKFFRRLVVNYGALISRWYFFYRAPIWLRLSHFWVSTWFLCYERFSCYFVSPIDGSSKAQ